VKKGGRGNPPGVDSPNAGGHGAGRGERADGGYRTGQDPQIPGGGETDPGE